MVLENTLESPLGSKEVKLVNPKRNQPWILTGRTDAEAELQCFGHLMQRANSLETTLMQGKTAGKRRRMWQWVKCLDGITDSMSMSLSKLQEIVTDREAWHTAVNGVSKSWHNLVTEQQFKMLDLWPKVHLFKDIDSHLDLTLISRLYLAAHS